MPRLWLLTGPVRFLVEYVAEYIVKSSANQVIERLRTVYVRREVQAPPGTPERRMLQQARVEVDRLRPTFAGGGSSGCCCSRVASRSRRCFRDCVRSA